MNAYDFNKSCFILCFSFYSIQTVMMFLNHSYWFPVCNAIVPHLELSWAAIEAPPLTWLLCVPLPVTLAGLCTADIFSLSLFFSSYRNGDDSFCGLFIRFSSSVFVLALMLLLVLRNNKPSTFTKLLHCFLPGPSLKHSFPMMYAKTLTIALILL